MTSPISKHNFNPKSFLIDNDLEHSMEFKSPDRRVKKRGFEELTSGENDPDSPLGSPSKLRSKEFAKKIHESSANLKSKNSRVKIVTGEKSTPERQEVVKKRGPNTHKKLVRTEDSILLPTRPKTDSKVKAAKSKIDLVPKKQNNSMLVKVLFGKKTSKK